MSGTWSGGYLTDEAYVSSYHPTQDPGVLRLVTLLQCVTWSVPQEGAVFVDVGCGRGLTTCAIAAANPSWTVIGMDYMPAHVSEARALAAEAGLANVSFHEVDLSEVGPAEAARLVPEADIVTLHGLWSWVSDAVQDGVIEVLKRLKPGGAAMVSYNALPGWSDGLGMQRLVHLLAGQATGKPTDRVAGAMDVVRQLQEAGAVAFKDSNLVKVQLSLVGGVHSRTYVAHEVWRRLARAKLDYVGAALVTENFLSFQLSPDQRKVVDALPAGVARELATDIAVNRQFRRDIFIRGARQLVPLGAWREIRLIGCTGQRMGLHKFRVPVGEAEIPAETMQAVMDALADGPRTLGELLELPAVGRMSPWELVGAFVAPGFVRPMWRDDPGYAGAAASRRFVQAAARRFLADDTAKGTMALPVPCLGAAIDIKVPQLAVAAALIDMQQEAPDAPLPDEVVLARRLLRPDTASTAITEAEADIRKVLMNEAPIWRRLGLLR